LSQLSKMTIQVVHDFFEAGIDRGIKIVFSSKRGEIAREFKINKTLIQDAEILPASFSLSTFNAPIALATISENLRGGYTAVYPSHGNFSDAILAAVSPILCGCEKQIAFVYAEEFVPEFYEEIFNENNSPLAFAALFSASSQNSNLGVQFDLEDLPKSPQEFLNYYGKRTN
ncbi:MAG: beta-ketoacyl synthase chain length factor, partial [Treponemataceae bacterium]|nr:beta-ketoacyl synthase chain length factor [Treponemataceae bacterium]